MVELSSPLASSTRSVLLQDAYAGGVRRVLIGEMEPHTIIDGSAGCFPGGKTHVQVTAPGYPMYCCWMIRHLDGNPWDKTRIVDPRYEYWEK